MSDSCRPHGGGSERVLVGGRRAEDVEGLLLSCHDKIRRFMASATKLAGDDPASAADVAGTASAIARYFREALPRHSQDEDASLRPRLEAAGFEGDLGRLAREHDAIDALLSRLLPAWDDLATSPERRDELRDLLRGPTRELAELFDRHLSWEEEHLVPRLAPLLGPAGMDEVLAEMRARRG